MRLAYLLIVLLSSLHASLSAQINTAFFVTPEELARAEKDLLRARGLQQNPWQGDWVEAARLHRSSARLRAVDDPQAVRSLRQAAALLNGAGLLSEARSAMDEAVDRALLVGDVLGSAEASLEAAWLAAKDGDHLAVDRHLTRAAFLSFSPHLGTEDRRRIQSRIALPTSALLAYRE